MLLILVPIYLQSIAVPTHAYSSCVGIEDGDKVNMDYKGTIQSTGEVFDQRNGAEFTIASGQLIEGFYQGVIGMKVGESKTIVVPPSQGYQSGKLAGKTLVFDVYINKIVTGSHPCTTTSSGSGFGNTLFNIIKWLAGFAVAGFIGVTLYFTLQKSTTPDCEHCKTENRSRLSEGKCGKCGKYYCRQSFSRGCPNCKSNTFVPNK